MKLVNIVCVLRTGGDYNEEYVDKLRAGVARNVTVPYKFVVLSNLPIPDSIPLVNDWSGWWNKIELFRKGLFDGPVFYLDLDTVITKPFALPNIKSGEMLMAWDFYKPETMDGQWNSTLMHWDSDFSFVYDDFKLDSEGLVKKFSGRDVKGGVLGDMHYIRLKLKDNQINIKHLSDSITIKSYKQERSGSGEFEEAQIISFHGKPRPKDIEDQPWMQKHWI